MKRFLTRLSIWSIGAFIMAMFIDAMITVGLRETDIRKYAVWNDIYKGNLNSDLLVLGSSRAWCCYNTFVLDSMLNCNSYNLGIDGHSFDMQLIRYQTYRRYNQKPKVILVNIDFLSTLGIPADIQYEREQFFPYIQDRTLISQVRRDKHLTFADCYIPLIRYFGYREDAKDGIAAFFGKRDFLDGGMYKGFRGNNLIWNAEKQSADSTLTRVPIHEHCIDLLDDFSKEAKKDNINVVFIKAPVYHSLYDSFDNISTSDSVFCTIAKKYDIPILDYYQSSICLDSSYFYNSSHLNSIGARLFTTVLCKDLLTEGLLEN